MSYKSKYSGADFDSAIDWVKATANITLAKLASAVKTMINQAVKNVSFLQTGTSVSMTLTTNSGLAKNVNLPIASSIGAGTMSAADKIALDNSSGMLKVESTDIVSDYSTDGKTLGAYSHIDIYDATTNKLAATILPTTGSNTIGYLVQMSGNWRLVTGEISWADNVPFRTVVMNLVRVSVELGKISSMYQYMKSQGWID